MKRISTIRLHRWFLAAALAPTLAVRAQSVQTLDLKPFTGSSAFDTIGAAHLLPRGRQVLDGIPFQMDGVVTLEGGGKGKTNGSRIPVGLAFERLHLLAATRYAANVNTLAATIHLAYADQTDAALELRFGRQLRKWFGPWHKKNDTVTDTNCVQAWEALASEPAESDEVLRLFHVVLTNPFPDKVVTSLTVETSTARLGLLLAGASVGPAGAARLPDTVARLRRPVPDIEPRKGATVAGQGVVRTETGEPVEGALVRVIGARNFKVSADEAGVDEPSVGKQCVTGADGTFTLPAMPNNKLYSLAILKDGFKPFMYGGEDPEFDPIDVRLKQRSAQAAPKYAVHGRLVGPDGKPVGLVPVRREGVGLARGRGWGWEQDGWPQSEFADTNGEFTIGRDKEFTEVQMRVHAPGFAPHMEWLHVSNDVQTIQLGPGAKVIGRVVTEGQPVAGVRVGVSGWERNSETYAGNFETATRADGTFEFGHLPPNISWAIYGIMSSFTNHTALGIRQIQTSADGTTNDLGDLATKPALHLAGQIKTRDGSPLPKSVQFLIEYGEAWDSKNVKVGSNGQFRVDGLYVGQIEMWVEVDHWRLSAANRSATGWNPGQLTGLFEENKEDLVVEIEKGDWNFGAAAGGSGNGQLPLQDQPQGHPIRGAEPSGGGIIRLGGEVVDDETGRSLKRFKVIPGYQPPRAAPAAKPMLKKMLEPFVKKNTNIPWNERIWWDYHHPEAVTNGVFSLEYLTLSSQPVLRVEADGFEVWESEPIPFTTNLTVRLKHGHGPNGIVLLPSGDPADKATVVYAAAGDSFSFANKTIGPNGQADTNGRTFQVTGPTGAFAFQPRSHGVAVYVSHPAGWAEADVTRPGGALKLHLKPWADAKGVLVYSNGAPAVGEEMAVNMGAANWRTGDPIFYFQETCRTDKQGHFSFAGLPPRQLHIERRVPFMRGWSDKEQTRFEAQPGVTNDLGKLLFDTPPPPPLGEQLKQKLGLDR